LVIYFSGGKPGAVGLSVFETILFSMIDGSLFTGAGVCAGNAKRFEVVKAQKTVKKIAYLWKSVTFMEKMKCTTCS